MRKIIVMLALIIYFLLLILLANGCGGVPERVESCGYTWEKQFSPEADCNGFIVFENISAASPDDVWALGITRENNSDGTNFQTTVFHYNGESWNEQSIFDTYLYDIKALDSTHVWAVGRDDDSSKSYILLFDGTAWEEQLVTGAKIDRLEVIDPSHLLAIGGTEKGDFIISYDGAGWTEHKYGNSIGFEEDGYTGVTYCDISSCDTENAWVSGFEIDDEGTTIWHYDGKSIVAQYHPELLVQSISAVDPENVWAVGGDMVEKIGQVYFYNGSRWNLAYKDNIWMSDIYAIATDNVVVSDFDGKTIYHYDGANWSIEPTIGEGILDMTWAGANNLWVTDGISIYSGEK